MRFYSDFSIADQTELDLPLTLSLENHDEADTKRDVKKHACR